MTAFARILIIIGLFLVFTGLILIVAVRLFPWLGNLPGDFRIERQSFSFFFPLATMILVSILASIILNVILKIFHR